MPIRGNFTLRGLQRFPPPSLYDFFLPSSRRARSNMLYLSSIHPIPRCIIFIYAALSRLSQLTPSQLSGRADLSEGRSAIYRVSSYFIRIQAFPTTFSKQGSRGIRVALMSHFVNLASRWLIAVPSFVTVNVAVSVVTIIFYLW